MDLKRRMINLVKTSSNVRNMYRKFGNGMIRLLGAFAVRDDKLILLNCFGGRKYDDSPRAVYEYMREDKRFAGYRFVWAFHRPGEFEVPGAQKIRSDSLRYFITAMKARVWITNSSIERGLSLKRKWTHHINTWHGTPIKHMGYDIGGWSPVGQPLSNHDRQNAQSKFEADVFSRAFNIPYERMLIVGYPRNDVLIHRDPETQRKIREKLGIPPDKKVILYAPTFREYERDSTLNCVIRPPVDFGKWRETLGDGFMVLMRCHYEVAKLLGVGIDGSFVRDVSDYPILNDLMLASDLLISDYSSIMFDYSILDRPILVYTYDYETYLARRGMYFDVRKELPGGSVTEDELLQIIKDLDWDRAVEQVRQFRSKYVTEYGHATEKTVDAIWELLQKP